MKSKRIVLIVLILIIITTCLSHAYSEKDRKLWRDQADHNRWTNAIIFGNESFTYAKPANIRRSVELLNDALLLCCDQFNYSYTDKLENLKQAGIPQIPFNIQAIDFSANSRTHRVYTHRGWNHFYTQSELNCGHADIRKKILISVVKSVFNFDDSTMTPAVAAKKCDAMCCLLYITHILGDRYHSAQYYGAANTLLLADDSESVIHDLVQCLPTLLSDQGTNSSFLIGKLVQLSAEIKKKERNLTGDELLNVDSQYAVEIKNLLKESLPRLLLQQAWFSAVFNPQWASY